MRLLGFIAAILIALTSPAQTLRDVLKANGIAEATFNASELNGHVNAAAAVKDARVVIVYLPIGKDNLLSGDPLLIQFNRTSGAIVRTEVKPEDANLCCGSPNSVEFIGQYVFLSFHFNPSAATMLVLDKDLKLVTTLYGFDVREIAPGQLVFIENMMHFAPVHPERLQVVDLNSGKRIELYPPQGDAMRAAFAEEHGKRMPPQNICTEMNDPCRPELYDESIQFIDNDQGANLAFRVHRDAAHATAKEQPPESVLSAAALYRYALKEGTWMYCEQALPYKTPTHQDDAGCTPDLPVTPDMSNADFSPFDRH